MRMSMRTIIPRVVIVCKEGFGIGVQSLQALAQNLEILQSVANLGTLWHNPANQTRGWERVNLRNCQRACGWCEAGQRNRLKIIPERRTEIGC
ncbi:MAG: hypothetical protein AUJ21_06785 [Anaerolineae bacterium CG1_02_58_13]|nr:MAG: hypothetical protein AUJ21_06785 [Anaerolineae bacterium CG1_02_58_13]